MKHLKKISHLLFSRPLLYKGLRIIFLGGLPTPPLLKLLDSGSEDVLLDVGCGTGFIAEKTVYKEYLGFDHDPKVIEIARRKNLPRTSFALADIREYDFSKVRPTKAVLYGILHHLPDEACLELLECLAKVVSGCVVTLDGVYSRYHVVNNLLCKLDRGEYVRDEEGWDALIRKSGWKAETRLIHYANTKIAKYLSYRLLPPSLK